MSSFFFEAIDKKGLTVKGLREASDESALIKQLQREGLIVIQVTPRGSKAWHWLDWWRHGAELSQKDVIFFTRELAVLLESGLPLDRSLEVMRELVEKRSPVYTLIENVLEKIKGGAPLSTALESQSRAFSRFYINMLRAGEAGGNIEKILARLSNYLDQAKELKDTVSTALIYPAILVIMSLLSVFLLLTFVVPQFTEMFASAGKELPLSTQIVIGCAEWLQRYWWALLLLAGGTYAYLKFQFADMERRAVWDRRLLRVPLFGEMLRDLATALISRTLGTLLTNGVPILTALSIVKETISNRVFADALAHAEDYLRQGRGLSVALLENGQFPKMAIQMIKIGEEAGKLEEMLEKVAVTYDKQLKITIQRLLALLEPLLIVVLGIVISGIIISILSAILSVNDLAF